jgi:Flp pilus assembly protein TadB
MIINVLLSIVFYFILIYLSVNLLGFFVRGFFSNPEFNKLESEGSDFVKNEIKKSKSADKWINVVALVLIIAYLYLLFHFWNIGVMAVAIILMATRLPDLLWEIKHGRKIDKSAPKNVLSYITTLLTWGMLPVLYYFVYHF